MSLRVLVVEDNPVNLELVTEVLAQEGCQVLTTQSAEAGLRLAAAERPDLILMDFQLPGMTGYEATRRLKAHPARRPSPSWPSRPSPCAAMISRPVRPGAMHT